MATKSTQRISWPSIEPGRLRNPITILQQESAIGVSGAAASWVPFATAWSEITNLRGTDAWKSGQFTSEKFVRITLRWQPGIVSNMRIAYDDVSWANPGVSNLRTFVVQDVVNVDERSVLLELLCVELDGQ